MTAKTSKPIISKRRIRRKFQKLASSKVNEFFFENLIRKTRDFSNVSWMGHPVWQDVLDLWIIQETLWEVKPQLLIECGTNRGGSAFFYAQLFDLIGHGRIVTIDVEKMHEISHPRIDFVIGSSTSTESINYVQQKVSNCSGPILVILDSDHSESHVSKELELYSPFVTLNSYVLVQDGIIDVLPIMESDRPGPLPAIKHFLQIHPEFQVDTAKSEKFIITHHPSGWLKRIR